MSKFKRTTLISCFTFGLTLSMAYGQTSLTNQKLAAATQSAPNTKITVATPEQFQSNVQQMDQKTQESLKQQVKSSLNAPPLSSSSKMEVTVPKHETKEESAPASASSTNPPPAAVSEPPPPPPPPPPPAATVTKPTTTPGQQQQPYTGFGGGTNNTKGNTTNQPASGGGWNIHY